MKRRGIDDGQQLGACGHGSPRRAGMPGVFANQQADLDAIELEDTALLTGRKVALFVEHAKIGQQLLEVARNLLTIAQHAGSVEQFLTLLIALRVTDDQRQPRPLDTGLLQLLQGRVAGLQKCRTQIQVLGRVAAQGKLGREQQSGTVGISFSSSGDDFLDIAREVSHNKIALGTANGKRHEKQARR